MIRVRRVYDPPSPGEGEVYLVDRLWPRGVSKATLAGVTWLRDVAPSTALRQRFHAQPSAWDEFQRRYLAELEAAPQTWQPLLDAARRGDVTLLYAARDREHNHAVVLRDYLMGRLVADVPPAPRPHLER